MEAKRLKEIFLAELPKDVADKLAPPFFALIDEAIESVIDGSTTMDGRKATNETEAVTLIRYGVLERTKLFHELILGVKAVGYENVTINYRGTSLNIK